MINPLTFNICPCLIDNTPISSYHNSEQCLKILTENVLVPLSQLGQLFYGISSSVYLSFLLYLSTVLIYSQLYLFLLFNITFYNFYIVKEIL